MIEPLAPSWPVPLMTAAEYAKFRDSHREEMDKKRRETEDRLEQMTEIVRHEHPDWIIATVLFDMGSQVGVAAGLPEHYRFAKRELVQGFTLDTLRNVLRELIEKSAAKPYG